MKIRQHDATSGKVVIDLTEQPYFTAPQKPLTLQAASGLERVRETDDDPVVTNPVYLADRPPAPADETMRFGGLGLAAVMDVGAHPIRARARRVDVLTVFAIGVVAAVGAVMLTLAMTLRP
jgi:hypothetical protein